MAGKAESDISWFVDQRAQEQDEPGLYNSFTASLATVLSSIVREADPIWIMGASGWAFRILVNEVLCPSATSVFDWLQILPATVEKSGHSCSYYFKEERRKEAHGGIVKAIDEQNAVILWDIEIPEWGVIYGYDDELETYAAMSCLSNRVVMPYSELGDREIKILSVAIPGKTNGIDRDKTFIDSLKIAVNHARQREWIDRPKYQDGLPAFDLQAEVIRKGPVDKLGFDFAEYYAGTWSAARCYARDYLQMHSDGSDKLGGAAGYYGEAAELLKSVWHEFKKTKIPQSLDEIADTILKAKEADQKALKQIEDFLGSY